MQINKGLKVHEPSTNIDEQSQYGWTNIWNFRAFLCIDQTGRGAVSLWLPHVDLGCDTQ